MQTSLPTDRTVEDVPKSVDSEGGTEDTNGCYKYFGVRSHLHQLYDYGTAAADGGSLLLPNNLASSRTYQRCSSSLWHAVIWLGIFGLCSGLTLMLAGYVIARQPSVVGTLAIDAANTSTALPAVDAGHVETTAAASLLLLVDRSALDRNAALDACKVAGLSVFCCGGLFLVLALVVPSCRHRGTAECCEGSRTNWPRSLRQTVPSSPTEKSIPASRFIASIQPQLKAH